MRVDLVKKNYSINSVLLVAWKTGFIDVVSSYAKDEAVLSDVFFDKDYKNYFLDHYSTGELSKKIKNMINVLNHIYKRHFRNNPFLVEFSPEQVHEAIIDRSLFDKSNLEKETDDIDFFVNNWKFENHVQDTIYFLLSPIIVALHNILPSYLLYEDIINDSVVSLTNDDPIFYEELFENLNVQDLDIEFLKLTLTNDKNFLNIYNDTNELKVDLSNEILIDWKFASQVLNTVDYINMSDLSTLF